MTRVGELASRRNDTSCTRPSHCLVPYSAMGSAEETTPLDAMLALLSSGRAPRRRQGKVGEKASTRFFFRLPPILRLG